MSSFIHRLFLATTAACGVLCVDYSGSSEPVEISGNAAAFGEPAFESIGVRQGMTSSAIHSVFVDRYGFVWLAGDSGVHRYDGQSVRTVDRDPDQRDTLASRTNADIAETTDSMWILSFAGILQRLDSASGEVEAFVLERGGNRTGRGTHLVADRAERLWISTDLGLFQFDTRTHVARYIDLANGEQRRITAVALSDDGRRLFAARVDGRLFALDVDNPSHFDLLASMDRAIVLAIAKAHDVLWLGTVQGLFRYDLAARRFDQAGVPDELAHGRVDAVAIADDGALWVGGAHHLGLTRFDPATGASAVYRHHPDDPYGLPSDRVSALAMDRRGNLWVGLQSEGAARLSVAQHGATRYRAPEGRDDSFCAQREMPGDGRLLVVLCGGSVGVFDPRNGTIEDRAAELNRALSFAQPTLSSHVILADTRGGYWLPTNNTGLIRWQPDLHQATRYPLLATGGEALPDPYMNDAVLDREGRLWVACSIGLAMLEPGASALRMMTGPASKLLTGGVLSLSAASDGKLWLGTTQGLILFDPISGTAQRFVNDIDDAHSLSDNLVIATHVDAKGSLWIGTQAGLNRASFDGGVPRFRRYALVDGLPDQTIDTITSDAKGILWVGTNRGIARFDAERDRFVAFGAADGVPDSRINWRAVFAASDGSIYFGSVSGLLRIFPERLHVVQPQRVMLSSYEAGATSRINLRGPQVEGLLIDYTEARARFNVAAFGDHRPMSYRLAGLENRWKDMPASLSVGYDPLPPGDYRFEVRQTNRGEWQPAGLSVPLTVFPPPWRTNEAYALYAAAVVGAFLLLLVFYRQKRAGELQHVAELQHLATYDVLTGLPNRSGFEQELSEVMERVGDGNKLALLFIDLDRFKNINDSLGHRFGDRVLIKAAQRLRKALPGDAKVARLGGDEFTVILPRLQHETEAAQIAQLLLDAFATPLRVDASDVVVSMSLGISIFPAHAADASLLIQYADSAMYYAKQSGRNAFRVFRPEMVAKVSRRLALETSLRQALSNNELYIAYQPQIALDAEQICGVEILLRWANAEHGIVAPVEFIPILEDTGMIHDVGMWVIEQACARLTTWKRSAGVPLRVAVNLSLHQLIRGDLSDRLARLLASLEIPRNALEFELTETAVMESVSQTAAALDEMRSLGVGIAIDDFGTGYSSFAALSQLPVDKLKIDKKFIDGVGLDERADTLCAAIIAMAHNLKLCVVAEGVETESQHHKLKAMGCDYAQGYFYSKPLPQDEFEQLVKEHSSRRSMS